MVKKLFKYEFIYYIRTCAIFFPILLAASILARIFIGFMWYGDNSFLAMLGVVSLFVDIFGAIGIVLFCFAVSIVRFYKNIYSTEGYLTLTLPIPPSQHIIVKLVTAMVVSLVGTLVAVVAIIIPYSAIPEFFAILKETFANILASINNNQLVWYVIEYTLLMIVGGASGFLLIYACISIGQTAKKNRILKAIGAYFVWYIVSQLVFSVITAFGMGFLSVLFDDLTVSYYAQKHVTMILGIVFSALLAVAYYLVTLYMMKKKLNLE